MIDNIKDIKNKKNSKCGEYYISNKTGDDYTGDRGYLHFRIMFEGISKNYFAKTWLDMKDNILIKIYIPIRTLIKLLKKDNIKEFLQMEGIYNSLPEDYKWWRINEDEIVRMSKVLKGRFNKICIQKV